MAAGARVPSSGPSCALTPGLQVPLAVCCLWASLHPRTWRGLNRAFLKTGRVTGVPRGGRLWPLGSHSGGGLPALGLRGHCLNRARWPDPGGNKRPAQDCRLHRCGNNRKRRQESGWGLGNQALDLPRAPRPAFLRPPHPAWPLLCSGDPCPTWGGAGCCRLLTRSLKSDIFM